MPDMQHFFDLTGKVIAITGGYGHLGACITAGLAQHGAIVYVLGRSREKFDAAFAGTVYRKENILFKYCDVAADQSVEEAFVSILSVQGKIDVLINNAFYLKGQSPEMSSEEFAFGIDGTLNSVYRCIRAIIPCFRKNGSGKIINTASIYGMVSPEFEVYADFPGYLNPPHYGAAKAGVVQLTKYYAHYLGKEGITVNAVTPGPFPSPEIQKDERFIEALKAKTALNRIGKPGDLAGTFIFLASSAADFITGQNLVVDGGWTSK